MQSIFSESRNKKTLLYILRLCVTLALLTIALYKVNLKEVFSIFVEVDLVQFALGMTGFAVMQFAFAWRTKMLLGMQGMPAGVVNIFSLNIASSFYCLVLPSSITGGVIRWHRLSSVDGERAQAFSVLVFERLYDNVIWLFLFAVAVGDLWLNGKIPVLTSAIVSLGFIMACLTTWAVLARLRHIDVETLGHWRFMPTYIVDKLDNIIWAFKNNYYSRQIFIRIVLISLFINILFMLAKYIVLMAFVSDVGFFQFLLVNTIINVLVQIPVTIAGIGVNETLYGRILPLLGIDNVSALCFGVAGSTMTVVWCLIGGVFEVIGIGKYHKPHRDVE